MAGSYLTNVELEKVLKPLLNKFSGNFKATCFAEKQRDVLKSFIRSGDYFPAQLLVLCFDCTSDYLFNSPALE